jgi:hypothetical protein
MKQIGTYYAGLDYDEKYWRISLFPFRLCLSISDIAGCNIEFSIFNFKIFIGSKIDDRF